ncbi:unnamed protein product, partial [Thlaspi arvense]
YFHHESSHKNANWLTNLKSKVRMDQVVRPCRRENPQISASCIKHNSNIIVSDPPQNIRVVFDAGSSNPWTLYSTWPKNLAHPHLIFDSKGSLKGTLARDNIKVAGIHLERQDFVLGTNPDAELRDVEQLPFGYDTQQSTAIIDSGMTDIHGPQQPFMRVFHTVSDYKNPSSVKVGSS